MRDREPDWAARPLRVTTPENVFFRYELAGPGVRFVAWLLDGLIIAALSAFVAIAFGLLATVLGGFASLALYLALFVVTHGYFMFFEGLWHGQTIGKRAMGIRVIDREGFRMSWGQSAIRNLVRMADALPLLYLVGGAVQAFNRQGLRLGDMVAGTVVVKVIEPLTPTSAIAPAERYDPLLQDFELCERVRRVIKVPERDLLGALALRRERLEDAYRLRLFGEAARYFEERLQIPRPEFVSPERYILNLCTIAFIQKDRATAFRERR